MHRQAPWGRHGCLSGDGCKELPTPTPVDLMGQVESYIAYILAHQAADGWLGPASSGGGSYWGPSNVLQALWQWAEAKQPTDAAAAANATQAVLRHLLAQYDRMRSVPLASWAQARWVDMAHTVEWLLEHDNQLAASMSGAQRATLLKLLALLHTQGEDWDSWCHSSQG